MVRKQWLQSGLVFSSALLACGDLHAGARNSADPYPTAAWRMVVNGFEVIEDGVGTTGRHSSYHGKRLDDAELFELPVFSGSRLHYSGDRVPAAGYQFDEGVLGYRIDEGNLVVAVAAGVSAEQWGRGGGSTLIGQGDLFVTVEQNGEVNHYALLNEMNGGRRVGQARWRAAQQFRYGGGAEIGHAVLLTCDDEITLSGGEDGHDRGGKSPCGLDERVFAHDGTDTGVGQVQHYSFDAVQPLKRNREITWHVSEWVVPLATFGDLEEPMQLAFHIAPSCGNDQINGRLEVAGQPADDSEKKTNVLN